MKNKIMITVITIVMLINVLIPANVVFADDNRQTINIYVNGEWVEFDVKPFISVDSRTMSPLRFVSEALGFEVVWYGEKFQVGITGKHADGSDLEVILPIGVNYAYVNGEKMYFDTNTIIVDNRTFVPLRFVSEVFGAEVGYEYGRDIRHNGEFAHIIDVDMVASVDEKFISIDDFKSNYTKEILDFDIPIQSNWSKNIKADFVVFNDYFNEVEKVNDFSGILTYNNKNIEALLADRDIEVYANNADKSVKIDIDTFYIDNDPESEKAYVLASTNVAKMMFKYFTDNETGDIIYQELRGADNIIKEYGVEYTINDFVVKVEQGAVITIRPLH